MTATFHDLKDASVFISGGASGIGAALVEGFLAQGARTAFCDIAEESGTALCTTLGKKYGAEPRFFAADVTDIPSLKSALNQAEEAHGPITTLVNNAALDTRHSLEGFSVEAWDASIAVNLRHHFFAAQHVAPAMRSAGGGSIINFSSISYMMGNAGYDSYVAAKSGITGLTRGLARELGPENIRVNAVMPGWVLTDRQKELWASPESLSAFLDRQCLKTHLTGKDIVGGVLFLASDLSAMVTGQGLVIDAGVVHTG